ncbi:helix-turn-helix domain-containing protein [Nocardia wallacei]|uniref:helix-turn-helix domain-containing protein n=1 Tax=Nocardia wallacei TaxID=480035 RepID=UPI0024580791|nr:helix-turn-helix transcriptional regulator [Nocardia wallacei]
MSTSATGSTLARRMLGRALKRLREAAGIPPKEAAKAIRVSAQTIWRIETGQQGPKLKELYVEALCKLYGAAPDETRALAGLVELAERRSWWQPYGDAFPGDFGLFIGLEEFAREWTTFQLTLVPGILQTADYRRAGVWALEPQASPTEVERNVELTVKRQERLHEDRESFNVQALLCESVLRYPIGGPAVMGRQLRHLEQVSEMSNVSLRVVPLSAGMHVGLQIGSFVLLEFSPHSTPYLSEPPIVYVDGYTGALYLEQENEIRQYRQGLVGIRRVALEEGASRELVARIAREYEA